MKTYEALLNFCRQGDDNDSQLFRALWDESPANMDDWCRFVSEVMTNENMSLRKELWTWIVYASGPTFMNASKTKARNSSSIFSCAIRNNREGFRKFAKLCLKNDHIMSIAVLPLAEALVYAIEETKDLRTPEQTQKAVICLMRKVNEGNWNMLTGTHIQKEMAQLGHNLLDVLKTRTGQKWVFLRAATRILYEQVTGDGNHDDSIWAHGMDEL